VNYCIEWVKHSEALVEAESIDTGDLLKETRWQASYFSKYYVGLADKVQGVMLPIDKPNMFAVTIRHPLGVVAAIVPWNSQLFLTALKVALMTGSTVVLKALEHASAPMLELAKIFEEAGVPPCVINIDNAINGILLSIFSVSGQSCVVGSRLLMHEKIYDEVLQRVAKRVAEIRIGDPFDDDSQIGP
jgi:acyl-CoA reductase-like NAD-dependent aldehyde dehydrogenase